MALCIGLLVFSRVQQLELTGLYEMRRPSDMSLS
jgi:hypothetical protein